MSDFQKAISVLRSLGIGVTVENKGHAQIATIKGKDLIGEIVSMSDLKKTSQRLKGKKV